METNNTKQTIKEKRECLKALSTGLNILKQEGAIDTVNEAIKKIYAEQGHTTLKTYNQWKKEGMQVKKGEQALLLWGRPKNINQPEQNAETAKNAEEENNGDTFFPICYVFSNKQVYSPSKAA
jgi:hypothetical protein